MIGLAKGTVQVVPYLPSWRDAFAQERRLLQEHIGGHVLDIQHIGSTAVPGLDAKPIIDIAVALASRVEIARCRQPLHDLGYIDRGDCGTEGGYLFVKESAPEVRTHHLHLVATLTPAAQVQARRMACKPPSKRRSWTQHRVVHWLPFQAWGHLELGLTPTASVTALSTCGPSADTAERSTPRCK